MSSFHFSLHTQYRPYQFTEKDYCAVAQMKFKKLCKEHFASCNTLYYAALVEDIGKNCMLYDLESYTGYLKSKDWREQFFVNPVNRMRCERIHLIAIEKTGNSRSLCSATTLAIFEKKITYYSYNTFTSKIFDKREKFNILDLIFTYEELINIHSSYIIKEIFTSMKMHNINYILSEIESRYSHLWYANNFLGTYYYEKEKYSKAVFHFEKAFVLKPEKETNPLFMAALSYKKIKQYEKAIIALQSAIKISSNYQYYRFLGEMYLRSQHYEKAKEYLLLAEMDDPYHKSSLMLAETYKEMGQLSKAESIIYSKFDYGTNKDRAYLILGEIAILKGDNKTAYYYLQNLQNLICCDFEDRSFLEDRIKAAKDNVFMTKDHAIFLHIFSFLPLKDLYNVRQVNRYWRQLSDNNSLWSNIFKSRNYTFTALQNIASAFAKAGDYGVAFAACFRLAKKDANLGALGFRDLCILSHSAKKFDLAFLCYRYTNMYNHSLGNEVLSYIRNSTKSALEETKSALEENCNKMVSSSLEAIKLDQKLGLCLLKDTASLLLDSGQDERAFSLTCFAESFRKKEPYNDNDNYYYDNPLADLAFYALEKNKLSIVKKCIERLKADNENDLVNDIELECEFRKIEL